MATDSGAAAVSGQASKRSTPAEQELLVFLNELRVALPGVQILFAFLLSVPFSARFGVISGLQRRVFFAAFLCCAASSALLIAPSVYHRLHWHTEVVDTRRMLLHFNRLAIMGGACLAAAMTCAVFLITDLLVGRGAAAVLAAIAAFAYAWLWFALPAARRRGERRGAGRPLEGSRDGRCSPR